LATQTEALKCFARVTSEVHAERRLLAFTEAADAVALVAFLRKPALIAALDREIDCENAPDRDPTSFVVECPNSAA
jgi:hypothetical protein